MKNINFTQKHIHEFCRKNKIKSMALFGSVLRDDFSSNSDLDILVVFEPSARVSFITFGQMNRELSGIFHLQVDLVPQEGLKPAIRDSVLASAVAIYAS